MSVAPRAGREVLRRFEAMPEIKLVCSVSGEYDYVAWIRADHASALDASLDEIGEVEGVLKTTTSVVLAERINRGGDVKRPSFISFVPTTQRSRHAVEPPPA